MARTRDASDHFPALRSAQTNEKIDPQLPPRRPLARWACDGDDVELCTVKRRARRDTPAQKHALEWGAAQSILSRLVLSGTIPR